MEKDAGETVVTIEQPAETRFRQLLRKWIERTMLEADGTPCEDGRGGDLIYAEWFAARALGPDRAEAVRQEEYRNFFAKTGRCPTCGDQGPVPAVGPDHPHHLQRERPVASVRPAVVAALPVPPPRPKSRARSRAA